MLSVIIPAFQEPFLQKTIDSVLKNAAGEIEIIPVLDGYIPQKRLKKGPQVKPVILTQNQGMRGAINAGIAASKGKFIMKLDAHCALDQGFDKIITKDCAENWLIIPRRYSLDENTWQKNENRPIWDYHYISFPLQSRDYGLCMSPQNWERRTRERRDPKYNIDETMTFQGSCWVANKKYFMKHVGFLDDRPETYGTFAQDQQEIGLKYWLGEGEIKVNKNTWYAHLSKQPRHYQAGLFSGSYKRNSGTVAGNTWGTKHWLNNEEPGMVHQFSWLVEKFWPVPTWPEDRDLWVGPK